MPRVARGIRLIESDGRELINFGGNDYLGLAAEGQASATATATATGSAASALVCGWTAQHQHLADRIAQLESTESAVIFPSGFAACSGTVATLARAGDLILSDQLNHASLIDGCRLSRAQCAIFPHRDCDAVAQMLAQRRGEFSRVWLVTDGVFSMDGHVAPLRRLCDLAEQYDAILIVDEAHATGVLGDRGSGVCEALGVKDRVKIRIGTLSKAIGSQGGFVAAPRRVIDFLVNQCRPLIYSTALAPASVVAAMAAIDTIFQQPQRRSQVRQLARLARHELSIDADPVEELVPIIPFPVGDDARRDDLGATRRTGFLRPCNPPADGPRGHRTAANLALPCAR